MLVGLIGTFLPFLPGSLFIFLGAVVHWAAFGSEAGVGPWTLVGLGFLMVLGQVLDFLSGSMGAKYFGATRWGIYGGIAGAIVGLFFGLPGLLLGPLLGVLLAEIFLGKQALAPAAKSTWGTLLGTAAGLAIKAALAVIMIGWFVLAVLLAKLGPDAGKPPQKEVVTQKAITPPRAIAAHLVG